MLDSIKIWPVAVACAAFAAVAPARAHADARNEVRAVTFDEDADSGVTRVHVRGAQTPTFTVYKLERPSRVVIDLPQAQLGDALKGHENATTLSSNTWAVSTIAAQQLDDGGAVVRVIVTLARPGRYDVKTDGNEVVVMVQSRDPRPKTASPEALEAAQRDADAARAQADKLRAEAEAAQRDADAAKKQAAQASKAEIEHAKAEAASAQARAREAQDAATAAAAQAETAKQQALAEAASAKREAGASKAEAEVAKQQADAAKQQANDATVEMAAAKKRAADAQKEVTAAQQEAARKDAEAAAAREDKAEAERQLAQTKADAAKAAEAAAAQQQKVRAEAEAAKAEAVAAHEDAAKAREAAAADRKQADADKQKAEQLMHDAKQQLATLDQKMSAAQAMEDKAREAHAAAEAREESARAAVERAQKERVAAETAAKQAAAAAKQAAASERERLAAQAKQADARLAAANQAASDAESRRTAAESAVSGAKHDLEQTRTQLASVEGQRAKAEQAASDAAHKRSDAESAARAAAQRRDEAETAATQAAKRRDDAIAAAQTAAQKRGEAEAQRVVAEQQRKAAEEAATAAKAAKDAADRQRAIAEVAAGKATQTRDQAEASLADLTAKRQQAETAAAELEARSKAAAKAQAEVAAAEARKAGEAELASARKEAARLADDRKQAESELADRRKAVASQQAEADKLKAAAADARVAADREETRRAQLAKQRADEEQALASVEKQKHEAEAAAKQATAAAKTKPTVVAEAPKADKPAKKGDKAAKPAKAAPKASVGSIAFDGDAGAGRIDIGLTGDANVQLGEVTPGMVELVIDNAELAQKLERKLDVTSYGSPVKSVSSFRDRRTANRVRLIAELATPVTPAIQKTSHGVTWVLGGANPTAVAQQQQQPASHARTQDVPPTVVGGFGATSTPVAQQSVSQLAPQGSHRHIYHGATVDFDFKDAPIHDLLRTIADTGHVNIVVPDSITAKVTVRLRHVPWDQALEVVLSSYGLWYRKEGNLYRVAPRKELDAEDEAEAARRAAMVAAESPRPEVVTLNYASATELKPKLEGMLSPKGRLEVEERTNSLIINDVAGNREQIARLAFQLDTQTPQISIEARIVEADSDFKRQIGVQWGGNVLSGAQWGNATGLIFPSSVQIAGGNFDAQTTSAGVAANPSDFAVNIPAATGTGEGGAIGLSLGSIANTLDINLRLSALEDTSTVRIISAPKITVLNNVEAKISQGVSIPISVVSAAGTQTQFVQADLSLTVQPYVSMRDCAIAMKLLVTKNEPDFQQTGARGDPTILRKEARTTMLVNDGETAVLGGIYTRNSGLQYKKVPWFADLPLIGYLFKNRSENDDRTEVLVFITPKITNKASLRCQ